jgi:hypothetical protein
MEPVYFRFGYTGVRLVVGSRTVTATASAQFQAILVQHLIEQNPPPGRIFLAKNIIQ